MRLAHGSIAVACLVLLMTACSPSDASLATAIALTQAAAPTDTPRPSTATPTPTQTPEPTPTPTPDLRVIDTDPENLLLENEDLPADTYYGPPDPFRWPLPGEGEYNVEMGGLVRWFATFERGTIPVTAPQRIYGEVVLFKTADGARAGLEEAWMCMFGRAIETDLLIGDATMVCTDKDMQANGKNRVDYWVAFTRRNVFLAVGGWGWEGEVEPEFVEQLARTLLEKVDQAPLASEVSFTP